MANTINVPLPAGVWTQIDSSLTIGQRYTLQNRGGDDVQLIMLDTLPTAQAGHILHGSDSTVIQRETGFTLYCKPDSNNGLVVISEAV